MIGRGGSSSLAGKPPGREVRGRLVMVDMVRTLGEEGTKTRDTRVARRDERASTRSRSVSAKMGAEIGEPGKSARKEIGMRTRKRPDPLEAGTDRIAPEGTAEGQ